MYKNPFKRNCIVLILVIAVLFIIIFIPSDLIRLKIYCGCFVFLFAIYAIQQYGLAKGFAYYKKTHPESSYDAKEYLALISRNGDHL